MPTTIQILAYGVSTLITLLAVWVAYLALLRGVQPQMLAYYQPSPDVPSLIDLVIENKGGGLATVVRVSVPIPINCFGIEKPNGDADFLPKSGFPAIAAGQRYVFNGGQYAGLESKIGDRLEVRFAYRYRDPLGINRQKTDDVVLSVEHLRRMPSRTSAAQAIVDALKGPNKTTIQEIRDELRAINKNLKSIAKLE